MKIFNSKKMMIAVLCGTLVLGSAIGVSAAGAFADARSHGLFSVNEGAIILDGDAIGYWIKPNATIPKLYDASSGKYTSAGQNFTITIKDDQIKEDSMVELFYNNVVVETKSSGKKVTSIDTIASAEPIYEQGNGYIKVSFRKPQKIKYAGIKIESLHVTNPVNTTYTNTSVTTG